MLGESVALFEPEGVEDLKHMVEANCSPSTHIVVTDNATEVWVVPVVTSHHRHYIHFVGDEDSVKKAIEWLKSKSFRIVRGRVELRTC